MIKMAINGGILGGLGSNFINKGVGILQYADGTILLLENNPAQARNLKFILCLF
jgi:hypothetical protein